MQASDADGPEPPPPASRDRRLVVTSLQLARLGGFCALDREHPRPLWPNKRHPQRRSVGRGLGFRMQAAGALTVYTVPRTVNAPTACFPVHVLCHEADPPGEMGRIVQEIEQTPFVSGRDYVVPVRRGRWAQDARPLMPRSLTDVFGFPDGLLPFVSGPCAEWSPPVSRDVDASKNLSPGGWNPARKSSRYKISFVGSVPLVARRCNSKRATDERHQIARTQGQVPEALPRRMTCSTWNASAHGTGSIR
ncbi:hypothetical protein VTN02DRAFT_5121 [Thermoascus thermophilus]